MSKLTEELDRVPRRNGLLHAEDVVDWAREHPDSALHREIEWDDAKAAQEYRVWQARRIIALHVVAEGGERKFISLTVDRTKGGGYREVEDVLSDDELYRQALADALAEHKRVQAKYRNLKKLAPIGDAIDAVERETQPAQQEAAA